MLKEAKLSKIEPADRIFLYMEYEKASYVGCLLIDHGRGNPRPADL